MASETRPPGTHPAGELGCRLLAGRDAGSGQPGSSEHQSQIWKLDSLELWNHSLEQNEFSSLRS
jgi:hypothetical protein